MPVPRSLRSLLLHRTIGLALAACIGMPAAFADDPKPEKPPVDDPNPPKPAEPPKDEPPKPDEPKDEKPDEAKKDEKKAPPKKDENSDDKAEKKPKEPTNTIEARVKGQQKMEGLFPLYRDTKTGALRMEIAASQLNRDFIYVSQVSDGVVEGGHFRGQYRQKKVFRLIRRFDKIEIVESNPYFYYDEKSPLARSAGANVSPAVIDVMRIEAASGTGAERRFLVRADALFVDESFDPVKPPPLPGGANGGFSLGKLDKERSRVSLIRNYPENTAVVVDYVFVNPVPQNAGAGFEITDPRIVTVRVAHTLLAKPDDKFEPRLDDPRVGYFVDYQNDLTSTDITPWRDMISRWRLIKKDPEAPLSDPVKSIVWWIENTTPLELRPIIEKAALGWNKAFEAAGFTNVIVVKTQPDDADWDADDIRYNVIRWVASPQPPFSGYGPRFTNPLTGEILGADVILEYSTLAQLLQMRDVFEGDTAAAVWADPLPMTVETAKSDPRQMQAQCDVGTMLHQNLNYAMALSAVFDRPEDERKRLLEQTVAYLVTHEIGHTLGLTHNMMASQSLPYADAFKQAGGVKLGSVMDYPAINFAPPGKPQGDYFPTEPGAYDIWAIRFGYDPTVSDTAKRTALLARSTEKALAFANDADDMREPGKGIDPRINLNDLTDDAMRYAADRLALDRKALGEIAGRMVKPGESYQALRNAYLILTADMATQGRVISRYIGGVYVDKAVAGQKGAARPYTPVPMARQREAMKLLRDNIFAPEAFKVDASLLQQLGIERRGFFNFFGTDDPKPIARVANIQAGILYHLLHPVTLLRLTDSGLYGNEYPVVRMMTDLSEAIFDDDSRGSVNAYRQELQTLYVQFLMIVMEGGSHDYVSRAAALSNLRAIRNDMSRWRGDLATQTHRDHLAFLIDRILETDRS
ncbi:zinc-dependent metalloprotease [Gimibacter soli]|uniref:Zinc-dependent metalloprotease n=1 Tax=Gimibacter soli TaxID=3024400 RepID=A0AAE9XUP0_9PROT|nr:zinc-dependent metalloprotease [Gimibacter soli]WCL55720.1 zinc-dependent metalloprotease [Gimibacter soli]